MADKRNETIPRVIMMCGLTLLCATFWITLCASIAQCFFHKDVHLWFKIAGVLLVLGLLEFFIPAAILMRRDSLAAGERQ